MSSKGWPLYAVQHRHTFALVMKKVKQVLVCGSGGETRSRFWFWIIIFIMWRRNTSVQGVRTAVSGQPPPVCENCRGPAHLLLAQQATEGSGPPPWARSSALRLLPTLAVCRWWQTSSWGGRYVSVVPIFSEQRHLMFSSEYMCDTSRRKRPNIARTKHFLPAIREASCTALFVTWL